MKINEAPAAGPSVISGTANNLEMKPSPIEPSWILEGNPNARIGEHSQSDDDAAMTAIWDCTAGRFNWYYGWDETVMIIEGEVHVTDEDGVTRTLRAGDIAYFRGKTWATWQIDNYVRKIAFVRRPFPGPLQLAIKLRNKLKAMRSGGTPLRSGL
ncbi:cupin domain-containing protein [Rhizobium sp. L1K21]|uniref:cupin domain-containing protein n=1 Tax=Rhizobium sp. L1K21 TaxID=2954933 RepID=UPI002092CD4E|nr:cupin domain-containing protein [Rhizobium sp. L1K21]MCO6187346.1 cupin domain-containing protein [Rhizobium sp. L1K21]